MGIESKLAYRKWLRNSFEWDTARTLCLYWKNRKCEGCGYESDSNHAHHIRYRDQWKYTKMWDLRLLCEKCHKRIHELTTPWSYKKRAEAEDAFKKAIRIVQTENGIEPYQKKKNPAPQPKVLERKIPKLKAPHRCALCRIDVAISLIFIHHNVYQLEFIRVCLDCYLHSFSVTSPLPLFVYGRKKRKAASSGK